MSDQRRLQNWPCKRDITRRYFFSQCGVGLGAIALQSLLAQEGVAASLSPDPTNPLAERAPHYAPKAKRVIYLFMAGGPSQLELFDDKPKLRELTGQKTPPSMLSGKRFAFLKGNETLLGSARKFDRYGQCGMTLSELLPYHQKIVDEVCWLQGMKTDVFNHGPAKLFMNTGFQARGRPSMGSWVTYGLGSPSRDLPGFVVLQSGPRGPRAGASLWSSGFLAVVVSGRSPPRQGGSDPPPAQPRRRRSAARAGEFYETVNALNRARLAETGDPEILTRINAYEMAFRMQTSAPELMDLSSETSETLDAYGVKPGEPSFATNCLLARRLIERGVRFVQLYHTNWDSHGGPGETLNADFEKVVRQVDQPSAALVLDLKRRGLLEDTLVIWGGEFGRTPMGEVRASIGRDHHVDAFTLWLAGGRSQAGLHPRPDR